MSGANTTNALIFRMKYPEARIIYKNFLDIENVVLSGEVDAGVLIHESILEFDQSLCVEAELWDIWLEFAKEKFAFAFRWNGFASFFAFKRCD